MKELSVFIGYEEVDIKQTDLNYYNIYIEAEDFSYPSIDSIYIPSKIPLGTMLFYLIYDHELKPDFDGTYPHKVVYTDFYPHDL